MVIVRVAFATLGDGFFLRVVVDGVGLSMGVGVGVVTHGRHFLVSAAFVFGGFGLGSGGILFVGMDLAFVALFSISRLLKQFFLRAERKP